MKHEYPTKTNVFYNRTGEGHGRNKGKPFYYILNYNSENPRDQNSYKVKRFENFHPYLVTAEDFNRIFYETYYVLYNVTKSDNSRLDKNIQKCNPCNQKYNSSHYSYNDWSGRYVTCNLKAKYPYYNSVDGGIKKDYCEQDNNYGHICNPCGRNVKIAEIPDMNSNKLILTLSYEEIRRTGESFYDKDGNLFEFTSTTDYNSEYDQKYGDSIPDDYDTTELLRYYFP